MEVAGVVLGAIPIIIYALERYQETRETIYSFHHWKETLETLKIELFLQQRQLSVTLSNLHIDLTNKTTISDIERVLQVNHSAQCENFVRVLQQMNDLMNQVARKLYPDVQYLDDKKPPTLADTQSERLSWEWRRVKRSFGTKERRQMVNQLQKWNFALQNCGLERRETMPDTEHRVVGAIRKTFDEQRTRITRNSAIQLHEAVASGLNCECPGGHRCSIRLDWHCGKPLNADMFRVAFSRKELGRTLWRTIVAGLEATGEALETSHSTSVASEVLPHVLALSTSPPLKASTRSTQLPKSKKKSVRFFISTQILRKGKRTENHKLAVLPKSQTISPKSSNSSQQTVSSPSKALCSMLRIKQSDQPSLGCISVPNSNPCKHIRIVVDDDQKDDSIAMTQDVHLHAVLSRVMDQTTHHRLGLDRKQRFGIAAGLAWAVLHLCDSPWLEETLQGENLHLFLGQKNKKDTPQLSGHPYLSYDFRSPTAQSASPNQTPHSSANFQTNQIQNVMLYTLAIRLIELGLNKPFTKLREEYHAFVAPLQLSQPLNTLDDFEVAQHYISELYLDPGITYGDAVDRCLRFLFPGPPQRNTFKNSAFWSTFFSDVVAPVQATFELIPWSASQFAG